jgi:hypothetical protein
VVELEPAILEVARRCAPVNHDAMANPRVHVITGDAREVLMVGRGRYEPRVLRALEPLPGGRRRPLHPGVLRGSGFTPRAGGPRPPMGAGLRGGRGDDLHGDRHPGLGLSRGRDLAGASHRPPAGGVAPGPAHRRASPARPPAGGAVRDPLRGRGGRALEDALARFVAGPACPKGRGVGGQHRRSQPGGFAFARTLARSGLFDLGRRAGRGRDRRGRPALTGRSTGAGWRVSSAPSTASPPPPPQSPTPRPRRGRVEAHPVPRRRPGRGHAR